MRETFRYLLRISVMYSVGLWLFIMVAPGAFGSMFTSNPELLLFAKKALRIYCGAMFIFGIQIACQMTFISTGNAVCSIIVAVVRKFVLLLPLIYIVPHLVSNPVWGVYLAEPVADIFAVTFTAVVLFGNRFRKALEQLSKAA